MILLDLKSSLSGCWVRINARPFNLIQNPLEVESMQQEISHAAMRQIKWSGQFKHQAQLIYKHVYPFKESNTHFKELWLMPFLGYGSKWV